MATYQEIEQVQDFSRFDGAITALFWIVSFACFVGNFYNPIFGLLSFVIGAASLVFAALRLKKFRDEVLDGRMSFVRGYGYSAMTYLNQYSTIAQTKEFIEMMQVYGIKPEDLKIGMENLAALRPIEIALQFFSMNVIMGTFVSIPVAILMRRNPKKDKY